MYSVPDDTLNASNEIPPEIRYHREADASRRRLLQTAVVIAYRPKVAALARAMLRTPQHWEDAEQAGIVGLLKALGHFDPTRGVGFWTFAHYRVRDAIRSWIGHGVYWRPDPHEGRVALEEAQLASIVLSPSGFLEPIEERTPEAIVGEAEEQALLRSFAGSLRVNDRALFLSDDHRQTRSRRHKELVAKARKAFRREADEREDGDS